MRTVNIHEAKTHLSRLIEEAAKGEPFVIANNFEACFACFVSNSAYAIHSDMSVPLVRNKSIVLRVGTVNLVQSVRLSGLNRLTVEFRRKSEKGDLPKSRRTCELL